MARTTASQCAVAVPEPDHRRAKGVAKESHRQYSGMLILSFPVATLSGSSNSSDSVLPQLNPLMADAVEHPLRFLGAKGLLVVVAACTVGYAGKHDLSNVVRWGLVALVGYYGLVPSQ